MRTQHQYDLLREAMVAQMDGRYREMAMLAQTAYHESKRLGGGDWVEAAVTAAQGWSLAGDDVRALPILMEILTEEPTGGNANAIWQANIHSFDILLRVSTSLEALQARLDWMQGPHVDVSTRVADTMILRSLLLRERGEFRMAIRQIERAWVQKPASSLQASNNAFDAVMLCLRLGDLVGAAAWARTASDEAGAAWSAQVASACAGAQLAVFSRDHAGADSSRDTLQALIHGGQHPGWQQTALIGIIRCHLTGSGSECERLRCATDVAIQLRYRCHDRPDRYDWLIMLLDLRVSRFSHTLGFGVANHYEGDQMLVTKPSACDCLRESRLTLQLRAKRSLGSAWRAASESDAVFGSRWRRAEVRERKRLLDRLAKA
jgi:hypothetical protein